MGLTGFWPEIRNREAIVQKFRAKIIHDADGKQDV